MCVPLRPAPTQLILSAGALQLSSRKLEIITAKHLDKAYTGGTSPYVDGLLPIKDELLSSFQAAFKEVHDPRENNSHYPLDTLLAITFLALISGSTSINGIVKFSNRLSFNQAQLLGLPFSKDGSTFDLPKYHSYYRLLWRLDIMQLAPFFINWLNTHMAQLPGVLHPDGDIVRDTLFAFNRFRAPPSTWAIKLDYETPVGIDPDAPDGFKRDAAGNLID